ncbi:MAG: type II secretion system F family protein [Candidatus Margulisiibacteriota bacterium]|jgi:type II secretory pathway component PulF
MIQFIKDIFAIKKFIGFCEQLLTLLKAGFDLTRAIDIILSDEKNPRFKNKILDLKDNLLRGEPFTKSLKSVLPSSTNLKFDQVQLIPDLTIFLEELKSFYQEKISLINKIGASLTYPLVLLGMTCFLIIIFIFNLLPFYESFFQEFNLKMPIFLKILIIFKALISSNLLIIVFILFLIITLFYRKINKLINLFVNKLFFQENFSDILWLISLLLKSGFKLQVIFDSISFNSKKLNCDFKKFKVKAEASGTLAAPFIEIFNLPHYFCERLLISEKSGDFAVHLKEIAYEINQIESKKQIFYLKLLQPLLLIMLGFMILGLVYLTFLPIISSINNLSY